MKSVNWIKLILINLLWVFIIILPFLPGPPNKLVIALSILGQSAGFFGLVLIPAGVIWAVLESRKLRKNNNEIPRWQPPYYLSIIVTVIITVIYLILTVGLFVESGLLSGFLSILPAAFFLNMAIKKIKQLRHSSSTKFNPMPLYLLTIPLIALTTRIYVMEPLSNYSRSFAIQRSQALIAAIENYNKKEGQYPESVRDLESVYLKNTPDPFIMGILDFRYNKINGHYSVSFSQWLQFGSLEEIVLYDKSSLHTQIDAYVSYDYKLDLHRVNGAFETHNTRYDNWRYYLLD